MNWKLNPVERRQVLGIGAVALCGVILWLLFRDSWGRGGSTVYNNNTTGDNIFGGGSSNPFNFSELTPFVLPPFARQDRLQMIGACCSDCSGSSPNLANPVKFVNPVNIVFNEAGAGVRNYYAPSLPAPLPFKGYAATSW